MWWKIKAWFAFVFLASDDYKSRHCQGCKTWETGMTVKVTDMTHNGETFVAVQVELPCGHQAWSRSADDLVSPTHFATGYADEHGVCSKKATVRFTESDKVCR